MHNAGYTKALHSKLNTSLRHGRLTMDRYYDIDLNPIVLRKTTDKTLGNMNDTLLHNQRGHTGILHDKL